MIIDDRYVINNIRNAYIKAGRMENRGVLLELRSSTGMSRREFCKYFEIPYRTLQDWELGNRKMPDYLLRLIEYKIRMEKLEKKR